MKVYLCESCGSPSKKPQQIVGQRRQPILCRECKRESQADYIPTPEEIEAATAELREQKQQRAMHQYRQPKVCKESL